MKKISNQFVVNTVEDGVNAPFYNNEWYAWSNVATTSDVNTSPFGNQTEPNSAWKEHIPAQGNLAYLWKKVIRSNYVESLNGYVDETAQYFRMSGTNGTSIHTRGQVANASSRGTGAATIITDSGTETITMSDGDAVTQLDDGHLYQWVTEGGGKWLDLGQFKGESGVTYYTHIVWAENIIISTNPRRPFTIIGYLPDKPASDTTHNWMGCHVDQDPLDPVSDTDTVLWEYTWSNTKGNKGDKGDDASEVNPNILLRTIFDNGIDKVKEAWSSDWTVTRIDAATDTVVQGRKSLRINMANGQTEYCDLFQVIFGKLEASTWYTVSFNYFATQAWNTFLHSDVASHPAYYDASAGIIIDGVMQTMSGNNGKWQWPADWTGKRHTMTFKTVSDLSGIWDNSQLLFRVPQGCQLALCMPKLEIGQVATAYMANEDDLVGAQGKIGRFFYFGGVFNSADSTQTFVVNDAQAPYFEHTENGQKRYHVFNYDTNGTYTMAQMWAISNNWNNKPWESMTNDFKYIITEALFGSYAHLGSWIFNGDYMLSQTGVDGTENYTQFTGEGSTWQPNLYMNAKTGKLVANSGVIGGFNINNSQIKSGNNNIILNSNGSATIGGFEIATDGKARLKSTLTVGNATAQRIDIIPFVDAYNSQAIEFVRSGTGVNKVVVMELGFSNDNYGYIKIAKPATNQDVIDKYMSIDASSMIFRYQNTDYATLNSIDIKTVSDGAFAQFCYYEPGELEKRFECGIRDKTINLRAYKQNGDSAWPEYSHTLSPDTLSKGSVQVMSLGSLKAIFDTLGAYSDRLSKLSVLIIRNNAY